MTNTTGDTSRSGIA